MIIEFYDSENVYGRIETEENPEKIEELLNEYRKKNQEDYNIGDFYKYLEEEGIKFINKWIEVDKSIYF